MDFVRIIAAYLATRDFYWFFLKPFAKTGAYMAGHRAAIINQQLRDKEQESYNTLFNEIIERKEVLNGPFKGMKYPKARLEGGTLYPKMIGSYEYELHNVVEQICHTNYSEIINIGCAEGYYVVGLAMRIPSARVFAFDIDQKALRLTKEMALLNNVDERVSLGELCTSEYIRDFSFTDKGLIVCDCEGFEQQLFTNANIGNLLKCDLLIETHDFVDINISSYLLNLFLKTHEAYIVKSVDDIEKAKTYSFKEGVSYNLQSRKVLFAEGRPAIMEWIFLTSRTGVK